MRVYLLVMLIAAAVTFLLTPFARWVALRAGAITAVRSRDVHTIPTPRMGGLAMWAGLSVAMVFASKMPFLADVFAEDHQVWAVVGAAAMVCALGVADDIWDLDWMTKAAGQVFAAGFLAFQGVQLSSIPVAGVTMTSSRMTVFVTVLVMVVAMNAVNFVDGLDGLAAGVVGIGAAAFFLYAYLLTMQASPTNFASLATLVVAALVGICLGFLPHNFNPARIFMGDSGSMVLGLVLAASAIIVTGNIGTIPEQTRRIPAVMPLLLPLAVILLPLTDMTMAVIRRTARGKSPFHPDRMHLHHRMLALGHSHRRAVIALYLWTAVFAFGTVALARLPVRYVLAIIGAGVVVALVLTLGPLRTRNRFLDPPDQHEHDEPPPEASHDPAP